MIVESNDEPSGLVNGQWSFTGSQALNAILISATPSLCTRFIYIFQTARTE